MYIKKKKKIEKYDVKILLGQLKKLLFGPKYQFKYDHNLMYIYVCICHAQFANCEYWNMEFDSINLTPIKRFAFDKKIYGR